MRQVKFNPLELERHYLKITRENNGVVVGNPIFIRCDKVEVTEFNHDRLRTKCLLFKLYGKRHLIKNSDTSFTVSTDPVEISAFNKGSGWYSSYVVEILHGYEYSQIETQFETLCKKV